MPHRYYPDYEQFQALSRRGNVVPVYRQLMGDALTPVLAFQKIASGPYAFLLESAAGPEKIGRYCFLGSSPFAIFKSTGRRVEIWDADGTRTMDAEDPLEEFRRYLARFRFAAVPDLPRFSCGAVGYMGYDVVRFVEDLPDCPPDDRGLADIHYMFFDEVVIFDNLNKTVKVVCSQRTDGMDPHDAYRAATGRIDALIERLRTPVTRSSEDIEPAGKVDLPFESNFERADYLQVVERCKKYIGAGDIFQVVPSQRLSARTDAAPLDIYRVLRVVNPSPYMFFLRFDQVHLIGASPEVMVRVENRTVTVRPIAGTRRRGADDAEDDRLAAELLADPKERAEHIMLVDLGRNDVGRVARYNTVELTDTMVIEKYSHVMHIVSEVRGELRDGMDALDALKAGLPAGTLSGAPKVRAMQIIDEMERTKRGPYGGAVGYFDFSGNMDTCIAIRTIIMDGRTAYVQAGGGVVADSVPETEFQETLNKSMALLRAIQVAERMRST
ncbi:MAG: anthranilate synthase component I [Phycisphaerae bacterium]|nr:anthranilate synthase component I [Phycisphaerae bacterium]